MSNGMPAGNEPRQPRRVREPSLPDAIIPLAMLAVLIAGSLLLSGLDALDGPIHKTRPPEDGPLDMQFPEPVTAGPSADEPARARQEAGG